MDNYRKIIGQDVHFMKVNLKEDISVDDVARDSGYSLLHFRRIFMELTGETPGSYMRKLRLEEAAHTWAVSRSVLIS